MKNTIFYSSIFCLLLSALPGLAQKNYWPASFIQQHKIKSIINNKLFIVGQDTLRQNVLELNYTNFGEENLRYSLMDSTIYVWQTRYDTLQRISYALRMYKRLNAKTFDTLSSYDYVYKNDSAFQRINSIHGTNPPEKHYYESTLGKVKAAMARQYSGVPTFNNQGQLIKDVSDFSHTEYHGCVIYTEQMHQERQLNYTLFGALANEVWLYNGVFSKSVNYVYSPTGLPKFEVINGYNPKKKSLSTELFEYRIEH